MSMKVAPLKSVLFSKILIIERTMKLAKLVRGGFVISMMWSGINTKV